MYEKKLDRDRQRLEELLKDHKTGKDGPTEVSGSSTSSTSADTSDLTEALNTGDDTAANTKTDTSANDEDLDDHKVFASNEREVVQQEDTIDVVESFNPDIHDISSLATSTKNDREL